MKVLINRGTSFPPLQGPFPSYGIITVSARHAAIFVFIRQGFPCHHDAVPEPDCGGDGYRPARSSQPARAGYPVQAAHAPVGIFPDEITQNNTHFP